MNNNQLEISYFDDYALLRLSYDTMQSFLELPEVVTFLSKLNSVKLVQDDINAVIYRSK